MVGLSTAIGYGQQTRPAPPSAAGAAAPAGATTAATQELFELAETAVRVGDQYVTRGELVGDANLMLAPVLEKLSVSDVENNRKQIEAERNRLTNELLRSATERKIMYIEFLRTIPADKQQEALKQIDRRIAENFEENLYEMLDKLADPNEEQLRKLSQQDARLFRLAWTMKQKEITALGQLEKLLREYGSSLEMQQKAYGERLLGQQAMRDNIEIDPEVTHEEMLDYYQENQQEFYSPARARWQQITIRFDRFRSKEEAGQKIAQLGNELVLGGTPFWALAKRESQGPNADRGGEQDWTEWGNLQVSREINEAVFSFAINELSPIIADAEGLHIVRVLERDDDHYLSFEAAQPKISAKLKAKKRSASVIEYVAKLKERTPVFLPPTDPPTSLR